VSGDRVLQLIGQGGFSQLQPESLITTPAGPLQECLRGGGLGEWMRWWQLVVARRCRVARRSGCNPHTALQPQHYVRGLSTSSCWSLDKDKRATAAPREKLCASTRNSQTAGQPWDGTTPHHTTQHNTPHHTTPHTTHHTTPHNTHHHTTPAHKTTLRTAHHSTPQHTTLSRAPWAGPG
jgi:hypothetical protein